MNKKLVNILTNKLPIIACVILILMYTYLCIPDNYIIQLGGAKNAIPMPKNVPFKYKYRWLFVVIPILILIHLIYSIYYFYHIKSLTTWDIARDFFSQFQGQANIASKKGMKLDYTNGDTIDPAVEPDLARFVNFLKLAGDPRAGLYNFSQYFCNSFRPCSCCHDDNFLQYFSNGTNQKPIGTANNNFIDQCISIKNGTFKGSNKAPSK